MQLRDGEQVQVAGSTASYTLERKGDIFSCTCPAWRNQRVAIAWRSCKHLRAYLGEAEERARTGAAPAPAAAPRARTPLERAIDGAVDGAALEAVLASGDQPLIAQVLSRVELTWRGDGGGSALHLACRHGSVDGVRLLLDRGFDGRLVDRAGETPYDAIKHAWSAHRREADALYALLRARGLGPVAKPVPAAVAAASTETWPEGTRVTHAQLGDGVIKVSFGRGPDAKLTILFAAGMKTLLAKLVKRAAP